MNLKDSLKYKFNEITLLLIAFILPLNKSIISPLIILFFISSIWNIKQRSKFNFKILYLLPYIIWLGLGIIWSSQQNSAFFELEVNISFLAFPLIALFSNINFAGIIKRVLKYFSEGVILSIIIAFIISSFRFFSGESSSVFFYSELSYFHHPSYSSMYASFVLAFIYHLISKEKQNTKVPLYLANLLLSIYIVLLLSKTGILIMLGIHVYFFVRWVFENKKHIMGVIIIATGLLSIGSILITENPISNRFKDISIGFSEDETGQTSTGARLVSWKTSMQIFEEHPIIGVGPGDVDNMLREKYIRAGYHSLAIKNLNSHNQYLTTLMKSGIIGLLTLFLLFLVPFVFLKDSKQPIHFVFLSIILLNFITESMLQTQSGIIFIALFNTLFFASILDKKLPNPTISKNNKLPKEKTS